MASSAGLRIPYSIGPIFMHYSECMGWFISRMLASNAKLSLVCRHTTFLQRSRTENRPTTSNLSFLAAINVTILAN